MRRPLRPVSGPAPASILSPVLTKCREMSVARWQSAGVFQHDRLPIPPAGQGGRVGRCGRGSRDGERRSDGSCASRFGNAHARRYGPWCGARSGAISGRGAFAAVDAKLHLDHGAPRRKRVAHELHDRVDDVFSIYVTGEGSVDDLGDAVRRDRLGLPPRAAAPASGPCSESISSRVRRRLITPPARCRARSAVVCAAAPRRGYAAARHAIRRRPILRRSGPG